MPLFEKEFVFNEHYISKMLFKSFETCSFESFPAETQSRFSVHLGAGKVEAVRALLVIGGDT